MAKISNEGKIVLLTVCFFALKQTAAADTPATDVTTEVQNQLNKALTGVKNFKPIDASETAAGTALGKFAEAKCEKGLLDTKPKDIADYAFTTYCAEVVGDKPATDPTIVQDALKKWLNPGAYEFPGADKKLKTCKKNEIDEKTPFFVTVSVGTKNLSCKKGQVTDKAQTERVKRNNDGKLFAKRGDETTDTKKYDYVACVYKAKPVAVDEETEAKTLFASDNKFCAAQKNLNADLYGKIDLKSCETNVQDSCKSSSGTGSNSYESNNSESMTSESSSPDSAESGSSGTESRAAINLPRPMLICFISLVTHFLLTLN